MNLHKVIYLSSAALMMLSFGYTSVNASRRTNPNRSVKSVRIVPKRSTKHLNKISPRNPQIYNASKIEDALQDKGYHSSSGYKPKGLNPIGAPNPSHYYDTYLNGSYDLTSRPGKNYGKLITDRVGTYRLTRHHIKFRDLREISNKRHTNNYELVKSIYPHFVGWVRDDGLFQYAAPTVNGPFTKKSLRAYLKSSRVHHHRHYRRHSVAQHRTHKLHRHAVKSSKHVIHKRTIKR